MTGTTLWTAIAETLRDEIASGKYAAGSKLPTEAELAHRFDVNRHTVRRALADLGEQGLVRSRRGSGVFVLSRPMEYPLGRRVRFTQNLKSAGRTPERKILLLATRLADREEAEALQLGTGTEVHVYEGVSHANGEPISLFQSVFPAGRFPGLPAHLEATKSVTAALARCGVADYTRASTRVTAKLATPTQALQLQLPPGAPILCTVAVNIDEAGQPVEYGQSWFAGDRVTLVVTSD